MPVFANRLLCSGLLLAVAAPALAASGGFVESATSLVGRPKMTRSQIVSMLPQRGPFTFPAPYSTKGVRVTTDSDCGGNDCVNPVGYSYWRNTNNHLGQDSMLLFAGLSPAKGGSGPTLFSYHKTTRAVTKLGALFPSSSPFYGHSGEGWYFSGTLPHALYLNSGTKLLRYDVIAKTFDTVFDAGPQYGTDKYIWQAHSSDDDRVHSATLRASGGTMLGCLAYLEDTNQFKYFARKGALDECHLDRSGRWLVMLDNVDGANGEDNRIIDLTTGTETLLLDQQGAAGHADVGYGYIVNEDNWAPTPGAVRMWRFDKPLVPGNGQGPLIFQTTSWSAGVGHIAHGNARPGLAPEQQFVCSSNATRGSVPRADEVICYRVDGGMDVLVVAPVMTDLNASGGGPDDYFKTPKGNIDVSGRYFVWTSNAAGPRGDMFIVEVPHELLVESAVDITPPQVALTAPGPGAQVSGVVQLSAQASDDVAVAQVSFLVDGLQIGAADTVSPYTQQWPSADAALGLHMLTAVARDAAGNEAWSDDVQVDVVHDGGDADGGGDGSDDDVGGDDGGGDEPPGPPGVVAWTQVTNCSVNGGTLTKVSGGQGVDDARGISQQELAGDGSVEFTAQGVGVVLYTGLSGSAGAGAGYKAIDYALRLGPWNGAGIAEVRENNVWRADVPFTTGDVFRISVQAGTVRYYKNGGLFHTSATKASGPLKLDASIFGIGGAIKDAQLSSGGVAQAPPGPVCDVQADANGLFFFAAVPGAVSYHTYRGALAALSEGMAGACSDHLDPDRSDTRVTDPAIPPPGHGLFYLFTAVNAAGEGTLGESSLGPRTPGLSCE